MSKLREALTHLSGGDYEAAHGLVQNNDDQMSCLIHALVHRHEGDESNAAYWYRQAGEEKVPGNTLEEEWRRIYTLLHDDESE